MSTEPVYCTTCGRAHVKGTYPLEEGWQWASGAQPPGWVCVDCLKPEAWDDETLPNNDPSWPKGREP